MHILSARLTGHFCAQWKKYAKYVGSKSIIINNYKILKFVLKFFKSLIKSKDPEPDPEPDPLFSIYGSGSATPMRSMADKNIGWWRRETTSARRCATTRSWWSEWRRRVRIRGSSTGCTRGRATSTYTPSAPATSSWAASGANTTASTRYLDICINGMG